jgi:hypothetical protein
MKFVFRVEDRTVRLGYPRYVFMRAYISIDDSNDEQATIPYETGTGDGELRAFGFLTHHLGPVYSWSGRTPFSLPYRVIVDRSLLLSHLFPRKDWLKLNVLREGLLVLLEKVRSTICCSSLTRRIHVHIAWSLRPLVMDLPGPAWLY